MSPPEDESIEVDSAISADLAPSAAPELDSDTEPERVLAENAARLEAWKEAAEARYAALTPEDLSALASLAVPTAESIRAEWEALRTLPLTAEEERAVRAILEPVLEPGSELSFHGRTAVSGDLIYGVDDLLEDGPARVEKAELPLGSTTDPSPLPGNPPARPDSYAGETSTNVSYFRPDTARRYYLVVPNAAPSWIFNAVTLAANDITSALTDDCLGTTFVTITQANYDALDELERITTSVITVAYGTTACSGLADGCATGPRRENLMQSPTDWQRRMRLGTYLGFESDYDDDRDSDTAPDLTEANARYVALHELTHTLGFIHPLYPELDPNDPLLSLTVRVPMTAQGTAPSVTFPTANPLFSFQVSADDKQALRKMYSGQCPYTGSARSLGQPCSPTAEASCLTHGGACERDAAGTELCRWAHFKDQTSCFRNSFGNWQTSGAPMLPGETAACIAPASSLLACMPGTTQTASADLAGRCCAQQGGAPGLLFFGFSSAFASTFFCSDQRDLWDESDWDGNWEFDVASDENDFTASDSNWDLGNGNYTKWLNEGETTTIGNERMTHGCIATRVRTEDNGFSGIIFDYQDAQNYYVFDVQPSVRRRIRRVQNGVSTSLSNLAISYAPSWSAGITLMVCYGDGIHTFIDNGSRVSVTTGTFPTRRVFGLYNSFNSGARHAYLRSFPLVHGFKLAQ